MDTSTINEAAQTVAEASVDSFQALQFLVANAFTIVGAAFSTVFMIVVFVIFVKALRGSNLRDLFKGELKNEMSLNKFWTNIAYFAATIAFLAANLLTAGGSAVNLEMIWLIYLGTVASSSVASKWLALRYKDDGAH